MTSNRIPILAADIRRAHAAAQKAEKVSAKCAIEAGHSLIEAKSLVKHGEWLPFLKEAGIPERTAQRFMALAHSGLKYDTVSDLGGIKAALAWLQGFELPSAGEVLMAGWARSSADGKIAMLWPEGGGFHVAAVDVRKQPVAVWTDQPILDETAALRKLFEVLDHQCADMIFATEPQGDKLALLKKIIADIEALSAGGADR
jgi:hypothetical protein